MRRKQLIPFYWSTLFLCLFISAFYVAWISLAKLNFLYPLGYALIEIDQTITEFAPANLYKKQFSLTTQDEHIRLFNAIVKGIFNNGEALEEIYYHQSNGKPIDTLLTPAEIIHLNDVAKLIGVIDVVGVMMLIITFLLLILTAWKKWQRFSLYKYHLGGILLLSGIIFLIVVTGAEKVFYAAHTWFFPDDHQWFFYYQESLMTTLMKAPDLFAVIAIELLVLALFFYAIALWVLCKMYPVHNRNGHAP